jgi:hypothetical protein
MTLSSDIPRCMDAACPQRHECCRWTERNGGYTHLITFRVFQHVCHGFIPTTPPLEPQ